jgi:hypothetical protein
VLLWFSNGNIHTTTILSAEFTGAAGQKSLSEVQAGDGALGSLLLALLGGAIFGIIYLVKHVL